MAQKDVIVVVQRDALPKEKENLDILLVSTTGAQPVKVYRDIEMVKAVFGQMALPQLQGRPQSDHPAEPGQNHAGRYAGQQVQNCRL